MSNYADGLQRQLACAHRQIRTYTQFALGAEQDARDYPHWSDPPKDAARYWDTVQSYRIEADSLQRRAFDHIAKLEAEVARLRGDAPIPAPVYLEAAE